MSKKGIVRNISLMLAAVLGTVNLGAVGGSSSDRVEVEMVCYKPEAVKVNLKNRSDVSMRRMMTSI